MCRNQPALCIACSCIAHNACRPSYWDADIKTERLSFAMLSGSYILHWITVYPLAVLHKDEAIRFHSEEWVISRQCLGMGSVINPYRNWKSCLRLAILHENAQISTLNLTSKSVHFCARWPAEDNSFSFCSIK